MHNNNKRIEDIKARTNCLAYGRFGHWYKDIPRYARIITEKHAPRMDIDKPTENAQNDKNKNESESFCRPRGQ